MYPYLRMARVLVQAAMAKPIQPDDTGVVRFMAMPWDCDFYPEVNNGRHLTLFDLGRLDFALRTGLMQKMPKNGWGLVVAGSTIRYRKRIRPFQRVEQRSRVLGRDERWFYFQQTHYVRGEACASALVRAGLFGKQGIVPTEEIAAVMGFTAWRPELPAWVQAWASADALRPWPPE